MAIVLASVKGLVAWFVLTFVGIATWRYINPAASVAAAMLMLARIPDVLREMRTGERIIAANMPTGAVDIVAVAMMWLSLPLLCFSFYQP